MITSFKQTPAEQFVRAFVRTHRKNRYLTNRHVDIAIGLIDSKFRNDNAILRLYPGQYSNLTQGLQFYLGITRLAGNRKSLLRARQILVDFK